MSEADKKQDDKKKEIKLGDSIGLSDSVTVIIIRGEANRELDKIPKEIRQKVLDKAVEPCCSKSAKGILKK